MKITIMRLIISLAVCFSTIAYSNEEVINISIKQSFQEKYDQWTSSQNCHDIETFTSPLAHRVTVEFLFICKALRLGGLDSSINIIPFPSMGRALKEAKSGAIDIVGESRWLDSVSSDDFYISEPILRKGEFKKGIFGLADNQALFQVNNLNDLRKLTAISSKKWTVDWQTLESLNLGKIDSLGDVGKMYQMVEKGRGDYIIDSFRSGTIAQNTLNDVELESVPKLAIQLESSRHFVVSKKSPKAQEVFNALEKGIKLLRGQGLISRAYVESGFIHQDVQNWKVLKN